MTPMTKPPMMLTTMITIAAIASPFTNGERHDHHADDEAHRACQQNVRVLAELLHRGRSLRPNTHFSVGLVRPTRGAVRTSQRPPTWPLCERAARRVRTMCR